MIVIPSFFGRRSMPRLTIIVPTYDRSRFVARAVRSALVQSFEDVEVVVVDDG